MNRRFLVVAEEPCSLCQGTGVVLHPDWARAYQELGPNFSLEELAEFLGLPQNRLPPEEFPCRECGGIGRVRKEVPLEQALKEMRRTRR